MADTNIEWTDAVWNPTVGCSLVSLGCTNCYAMKMAHRIEAMHDGAHAKALKGSSNHGQIPQSHYAGTTKLVNGKAVWTGKVTAAPDHVLMAPLKWKKPRRIFVNSMSDLFHEDVPDEVIDRVFAVMALCPQHTFQVLTKRSKRMREYFNSTRQGNIAFEANELFLAHKSTSWGASETAKFAIDVPGAKSFGTIVGFKNWPLPNAWLGVSCEDQQRADERIPDLLATPAAVRFVSYEPALGPVRFEQEGALWNYGERTRWPVKGWPNHPRQPGGIDWIICGGESGPNRRPFEIAWAEDVMLQCREAGVKFFFKQDSGPRPGMRGRASDELWAMKETP